MSVRTENLRQGWTTGACAAAAAKAAFQALVTTVFPDPVRITLPKGQTPAFPLHTQQLIKDGASASIIKDAGDDPDVTHGAEIIVSLKKRKPDGAGLHFFAGPGVGMVTKPGLPLSVGEPAINPKPRLYITEALETVARRYNVPLDIDLTISIPNGEALATQTLNGRLGIQGGLSILGTTGIVIPYSCSSWIHSIHRAVDVARATGFSHIAASTGSTSEMAIAKHLNLNDVQLIEMGDFAGGLLKYLRKNPVEKLSIAGGFAKLTKLAQGAIALHSDHSRVDFHALAEALGDAGGDQSMMTKARQANSAMEVLELAKTNALPLANIIAARARASALGTLSGGVIVDVYVFDRTGGLVGQSVTPAMR